MTIKINGGKFRGIKLSSPSGNKTRPTSDMLREAVFNIAQHKIQDSLFLDLFAGTGAMGLEALSRGGMQSIFIEKDKAAINCIKENIEKLSLKEQTTLLPVDILSGLKKIKEMKFNIIYMDPPYGDHNKQIFAEELVEKILIFLDSSDLIENGTWDHKRTFGCSELHLFKCNMQ
jgi:16S rRNA (guanine966-N2)-methyltransferase